MPPRPSGSVTSPLVLLILGVGGLVGFAAILLVGPAPGSSPATPPAAGGQVQVTLAPALWGLIFLSPVLLTAGIYLVRRVRGGVMGVQGRYAVTALVAIAVLLALMLLFRSAGQGSVSYTQGSAGNGGGSNNTSKNNTTNNSTGSGGATGPATTLTLSLPGWVAWAAAAVLGAVVTAALVWAFVPLLRRRRAGTGLGPVASLELRAALQEAKTGLDRGEAPREVIVRLYGRLLSRLTPRVGDLGPWTAEEIRSVQLRELGLPAPDAEAITRLFEEARYSTHAMGEQEAVRAREAIVRLEAGLRVPGDYA